MPELPEVEVVRRGIEPYTRSWAIETVNVLEPRSLKRHSGSPEDFAHRLRGMRLEGAVRRGKFLWLPLSRGSAPPAEALLVHLGMSGQLLLGDSTDDFGRLLRVSLELRSAEGETMTVGFVDQRIFGSLAIDVLEDSGEHVPAGLGSADHRLPSQVTHIARDPLDPGLDESRLINTLRAKKTGIKRALLDQTVLSGVGNIYADEALWATQVHYERPADSLSAKLMTQLLDNVRGVFRRALEVGGTSFDWQYVNVNGQSGYFSQSLNAYGQDGKPCPRCGSTIVREPWMNRSSFRCPRCQRVPRKQVG